MGKDDSPVIGRDVLPSARVASSVAKFPGYFELRVNFSKKEFLTGLIDPVNKGSAFLLNV